MFRFGFWELLILVFVLLLVFGPKRIPQMGRSLGGTFRGFKDSLTNRIEQQDAEAEKEEQAQLTAGSHVPPAPVAATDPRERDTVL